MEFHYHSLPILFEQLGLPAEPNTVQHFIELHSPLPAAFLREEILEDWDWAEVVDELNARLHS